MFKEFVVVFEKLIVVFANVRQHINPLARYEVPAEGRMPEGEGANINWRLVPYPGKCK